MKFWTVQKYATLNTVLKQGIYQPDFSKSWYASQGEDNADFYDCVRKYFNHANETGYPGLIFAFAQNKTNKYIEEFTNYVEFYQFIGSSKNAIKSLWKQIATPDACVLELEYDTALFNPLFIDINDFQALMPPVMFMPPYTEENLHKVAENFYDGVIAPSVFPSYLIQAHAPFIKRENIVGVYPIFDI